MRVRELTLADFRSYERLTVEFAAGPHVVVGQNAAGKTNLLEALVVLSLGRSHRARADQDLIRWGASVARVEATVSREPLSEAEEVLEVALATPSAAVRARKQVRVNGVPRRAGALSGMLRSVLFAPESMSLVTGGPVAAARRT